MEKNDKAEKEKASQSSMLKEKNPVVIPPKGKHKRLLSTKRTKERHHLSNLDEVVEGTLPPKIHNKLWSIFAQIEDEFERLHSENIALREKLESLTEKYESLANGDKVDSLSTTVTDAQPPSPDGVAIAKGVSKKPSASQLMSQKLKTTYKASTSKIVSSFRIPNQGNVFCQMVHKYFGHKDGIWEVSCSRNGSPLLGTASADRTAGIWNVESCTCVLLYQAHNGSVNSIRFHPSEPLVCTGSGDGACHVWKIPAPSIQDARSRSPIGGHDSPSGSGDEQEDEADGGPDGNHLLRVKTPLAQLVGHEGPVSSADWWANGSQVVTASWDRMVKLWDIEKAVVIHTLEGHELEITHASAHRLQKLIVTSSQDTTFRLWDFRLPTMHSVNVFQGHSDAVTSAVFTNKGDHVVSGSDDRTVKVWDLKNMRSPITTIRLDSAVNRISLSPTSNIVAIPHDNRHVRLYDLAGNRLARLPRRHRQGHQRIVCSTSWFDDTNTKAIQLLTAGFDKQVLGWNIVL